MYIDISLRDVHQQKQLAATRSSHEILRNGEELFRAASEPKEMVLIKGGGLAAWRQLWTRATRDHQGNQLSVSEKVWPQVTQLVFELVVIN